jgi:hypothetical protein
VGPSNEGPIFDDAAPFVNEIDDPALRCPVAGSPRAKI